jgi:hypothetical protein
MRIVHLKFNVHKNELSMVIYRCDQLVAKYKKMPKEDDVGPTRHLIACGYKLTSNNMMRDLFGFVQGRRTEDTKAEAI